MSTVVLTWGEFKNLLAWGGWWRSFSYVDLGKKYVVWLKVRGRVFETEIYKGTEEASDFEANFKNKVKMSEFFDEAGREVVGMGLSVLPGNSCWTGVLGTTELKFEAIAGVENFFDIQIPYKVFLYGGRYTVLNANDVHDDDYIEFSIIDKDDVLGLFGVYGIPAGGFLELSKFVKRWWVKSSPTYEFLSSDAVYLIPGLYIRVGYRSHGSVNIRFMGGLFIMTDVG